MTALLNSAGDLGLSPHMMFLLGPQTIHANLPRRPDRPLNVARPPTRSQIETTSSSLQTPAALLPQAQTSAYKSTQLPSSAISAPKNSHAHTIFDLIFVLIRTSDRLPAMSVPKLSPASTTGRDTKASTVARKNSFVEASSGQEAVGAAAGGLRVPTPWAGISEVKLAGSASSPF